MLKETAITLLWLLMLAACMMMLFGCEGFSRPLIPVNSPADPVVGAAYDWNPCPNYAPYYHGKDVDGSNRCTVRPLDYNFEDVDQLELP